MKFEIINEDDRAHAVTEDITATVLGGKAFMRRAIKKHLKTGETEQINWLVCELNGVRAYFNGKNMIMTTQDLNP